MEVDERRLVLTRKELELLATLAGNEGEVLSRDMLLARVWGYHPDARTRTLGAYGDRYIETVFGVGYRFQRYRVPRPFRIFTGPALAVTA